MPIELSIRVDKTDEGKALKVTTMDPGTHEAIHTMVGRAGDTVERTVGAGHVVRLDEVSETDRICQDNPPAEPQKARLEFETDKEGNRTPLPPTPPRYAAGDDDKPDDPPGLRGSAVGAGAFAGVTPTDPLADIANRPERNRYDKPAPPPTPPYPEPEAAQKARREMNQAQDEEDIKF